MALDIKDAVNDAATGRRRRGRPRAATQQQLDVVGLLRQGFASLDPDKVRRF